MKRHILSLIALCSLGTLLASANSVLYWNDQALHATRLSRNPPPVAALHLATFHAAIFDTVNGFDRAYHPWLVDEAAPVGADRNAAIASAAYTTMLAIWGNEVNPRVLRKSYEEALSSIPDNSARETGIAWGENGGKTDPRRARQIGIGPTLCRRNHLN